MQENLNWDCDLAVYKLIETLQNENISICTTDTIAGFLAKASKKSFEKINTIKGRYEKPYIVLFPSPTALLQYVTMPSDSVEKIINTCWPGPLTIIFKAKEGVPSFMQSKHGTIAARIPDHKGLQAVMEKVGPLFSTSANIAGQPAPQSIEEINPEILKSIDLVITDRTSERRSVPSTILDCTDPETIKVIREGAYSIQDLNKISKINV